MRIARIVITLAPFAVVLTALAIVHAWLFFGVFSLPVVFGTAASIYVWRKNRNRQEHGRGPVSGVEAADFMQRRAWVLALPAIPLGALFASFAWNASEWWKAVIIAMGGYVCVAFSLVLGGKFSKRYEEQLAAYVHRGRGSRASSEGS